MKNLPKFLIGMIWLGLLGVIFIASPASAQITPGSIPFGGTIVHTLPCWCSGNLLITTFPVAGSAFNIFQFGFSRLFEYGQIYRPGAWLLGNTLGTAPCIIAIPSPPYCMSIGVYPLISIVGTSI